MGLRYQGSEAQGEVELEQKRQRQMDIRTTVFLQRLPKYDEWPADTTVQLKADISIVYSQLSVIRHLFLPWLCWSFASHQ